MQNLETLRQLSLGDLADDGRGERERERREEKIMPSLMATLLRWRTHSARTKIETSELRNKNVEPCLGDLLLSNFEDVFLRFSASLATLAILDQKLGQIGP
jgi:hypothetical protein